MLEEACIIDFLVFINIDLKWGCKRGSYAFCLWPPSLAQALAESLNDAPVLTQTHF